jgi:hypothetical protein
MPANSEIADLRRRRHRLVQAFDVRECSMSSSEAIRAIEIYVRKCGRDHSQWCTGIAADPVERMLKDHGVAEEGDGCGWITYNCASADAARLVRDHLVASGMRGATGGFDPTMTSVFVFKITSTTRI